jgi:hypothetical protein
MSESEILKSKEYPKPVQGSFYKVGPNMDLKKVSIMAYGYSNTEYIVRANTALQNRTPGSEGYPPIYKDENIWIPIEVASE